MHILSNVLSKDKSFTKYITLKKITSLIFFFFQAEDGIRDIGRDWSSDVCSSDLLFQVGMTVAASTRIQDVVDEGPTSLVEPGGYAFAIWALIFALSLAYAIYQALPVNRENPLLRRIVPFTAAAFFCTGMWSVFVPLRQFLFAQAMLLGTFACLLVAYARLARSERGVLSGADRWLVALPLGLFLGWVTAANPISLTSEVVRQGLV